MKVFKYTTGPIQVNTYLAYDETNTGFLVDPGGYSVQIVDRIKAEGIDLQYIILTHGHADHIGGIEQFKEKFPNVKLIALDLEKEMLNNSQCNVSMEICGREIELDADKYVKDGEELCIGNMNLHFLSTPGHTKGGMCIYTDGRIFSGDTLFRASIGRTDFYGGSFEQIIDSIKNKLFKYENSTIVYPGHMDETTIGFEKENNPFV